MTLEELESRLEGRTETQTFEVKGPCDWNAPSLAKDILAMANVKDGGIIVIGIEDNTFNRIGVNTAQRDTYNLDTMKDQIAPYADPNVDFKKEVLTDDAGLEYVVITVFPFEEIPVICKKEGGTGDATHVGIVYYRNTNGRIQSGAVSNANDMRKIILTATLKMMQNLSGAGFTVPSVNGADVKRKLDDELGEL